MVIQENQTGISEDRMVHVHFPTPFTDLVDFTETLVVHNLARIPANPQDS